RIPVERGPVEALSRDLGDEIPTAYQVVPEGGGVGGAREPDAHTDDRDRLVRGALAWRRDPGDALLPRRGGRARGDALGDRGDALGDRGARLRLRGHQHACEGVTVLR